jgi:hypothetical protein
VLPGVGHFPQVERPAEVADLITEFVATTPPRPQVTSMKRANSNRC